MAELVQNNAGKDQRNEENGIARRGGAVTLPGAETDPSQENDESDVDSHRGAAEAADRQ